MSNRTLFLTHARRIHNALRHAIESGDGRTDDIWVHQERPVFEHYTCGMYLINCLAYLEGRYGEKWSDQKNNDSLDFDGFIENDLPIHQKRRAENYEINKAGLEALICIRNALVHNANDLRENNDKNSEEKVTNAQIKGVEINNGIVTLISNREDDFMEYVRLAFIFVSNFNGDS